MSKDNQKKGFKLRAGAHVLKGLVIDWQYIAADALSPTKHQLPDISYEVTESLATVLRKKGHQSVELRKRVHSTILLGNLQLIAGSLPMDLRLKLR